MSRIEKTRFSNHIFHILLCISIKYHLWVRNKSFIPAFIDVTLSVSTHFPLFRPCQNSSKIALSFYPFFYQWSLSFPFLLQRPYLFLPFFFQWSLFISTLFSLFANCYLAFICAVCGFMPRCNSLGTIEKGSAIQRRQLQRKSERESALRSSKQKRDSERWRERERMQRVWGERVWGERAWASEGWMDGCWISSHGHTLWKEPDVAGLIDTAFSIVLHFRARQMRG